MKFSVLFKKELKEMLSVQTIMVMVISVVALVFAGQALGNSVEESVKDSMDVVLANQDVNDTTGFTDSVVKLMDAAVAADGGELRIVTLESDDYAAELKRLGEKSMIIIPEGFAESVTVKKELTTVKFVQRMTSLSTMSNLSTGSDVALSYLVAAVKSGVYQEKLEDQTMTAAEIALLENPIELEETTVVGDKSEQISSSIVLGLCSAQSMLVPIIMFVVIIYSSQMILNGMATEKVDKTLETLLSAPISRLSVIAAKMLSAGVVSALQAAVYMLGMRSMMNSLTSGSGGSGQYDGVLERLGLTLGAEQYIFVGLQMFLSILIALSASLILGVLAKDSKSAQTLLLPITFCTMIPYMLSMFVDIKTLPGTIKYIVYAIPFTHAFMASENVMFSNTGVYIGGMIYQIALLAVCLTIALRIFMSDKIFTMSIGVKKKKKGKEEAAES